MGSMTDAFETALLKHVVDEAAWTPPETIHAALLTAVTDAEAGTVTECADGGYARQPVSWSAVAGGATANSTLLQWPAAVAGYTVAGVALYSDQTAGELLFVDDITPVELNAGDRFEIAVGDLDLSFD